MDSSTRHDEATDKRLGMIETKQLLAESIGARGVNFTISWIPIALQSLLLIIALIGFFVVTDRRITIVEQQGIRTKEDVQEMKDVLVRLQDNLLMLSRIQASK